MSDQLSEAEKRMEFALKVFKDFPDKIPLQIQEKILAQQVVLGMAPYEAHLAAGEFVFMVQADQSKWPKNADPYKVMWAQSLNPDNSKIWMTFETNTQWPEKGLTRFRVFFQQGKAVEIDELAS
jgi:hypothetical protein